jgi:hypothetical protein
MYAHHINSVEAFLRSKHADPIRLPDVSMQDVLDYLTSLIIPEKHNGAS